MEVRLVNKFLTDFIKLILSNSTLFNKFLISFAKLIKIDRSLFHEFLINLTKPIKISRSFFESDLAVLSTNFTTNVPRARFPKNAQILKGRVNVMGSAVSLNNIFHMLCVPKADGKPNYVYAPTNIIFTQKCLIAVTTIQLPVVQIRLVAKLDT